ncbi:hypothetical protein [Providencia sp. PROV223]|uniref:hypothetical protein n=1 Tax=Providencia sp. PROV223 TaxID=2949917 RepID=UPI00234ABD7E|nr:hypothetical protein [Providencia sp. PROV223]
MNKTEKNKALIKLIKDVVIESGTKIVETVPVIGPAAGVIKGLVENTKNLYDAINKQKLYDFYMGIYELDDSKDKFITNDNLAFVIKKLLQDDDERKTKYYSRLVVNVSSSKYDNDTRKHLILTLSNLSTPAINTLRKFYINNKYELEPLGNVNRQLSKLSHTSNGLELSALSLLQNNGLIFKDNSNSSISLNYEVTNLLIELAENIFDVSDLHPTSIGDKLPKTVDCYVTSCFCNDMEKEEYLSEIKNSIYANNKIHEKEKLSSMFIEKHEKLINCIKNELIKQGLSFKIGPPEGFSNIKNNCKIFINIIDTRSDYLNFNSKYNIKMNNKNTLNIKVYDNLRPNEQINSRKMKYISCANSNGFDEVTQMIDRLINTNIE